MALALQTGKAGEQRVVAELLLRGHIPFLPVVDDRGVDIMLSTGIRLQVKAAKLTRNVQDRRLAYRFTLSQTQRGNVKNRKYAMRTKLYSEECDFVVFHGIDEHKFWIVPSFIADNRRCLVISTSATRIAADPVMELRNQGKFYSEIAQELGVCEATVCNRVLRGDVKKGFGGFVRAVRMCEDRWDFLANPRSPEITALEEHKRPRRVIEEQEVRQLENLLDK